MRLRTWIRSVAAAFGAIWIGLAGASAFHPNDPSLVPSELVWQVFGLLAYAGILALPIMVIIGFASAVVHLSGRCHTRNQGA